MMSFGRLENIVRENIENVLVDAYFPEFPGFSRGKVRDSYDLGNGKRVIVSTDRLSAFDRVLEGVPFKGQVLNDTSRFWFDVTRDVVANHVIDFVDENICLVHSLRMIPLEIIVRNYLAGSTSTSIWPMYQSGKRRIYGENLPDNLIKNEKLPRTIITPTTKKSQGGRDYPITSQEIIGTGLLSAKEWNDIEEKSLALFEVGSRIAARNGLILADTKYEFGRNSSGQIVLADEIHTPDSSRYWRQSTYAERLKAGADPDCLDKDFFRRWILERCDPYIEEIPKFPKEKIVEFGLRYIDLFESITGSSFCPILNAVSPRERIFEKIKVFL